MITEIHSGFCQKFVEAHGKICQKIANFANLTLKNIVSFDKWSPEKSQSTLSDCLKNHEMVMEINMNFSN